MKTEQKLIELVTELNSDYYSATHDDELNPYEYYTNGYVDVILFFNECVFSSEEDLYDDEKTFKEIVLGNVNKILTKLEKYKNEIK
jgi:hypothetical protein